jgi:ATP phosphoribosyltransferase regulatory subunit
MNTKWRLPKGVDEILPPAAWEFETLRRRVLDLFVSWGFDYVEPPVIEYLDALLVGTGEDLDLQTLKVVDQVSGKQLGVRADMTSQAVRIDAHSRKREGVHRLCYAGPVVFANPRIAQSSRVPFKAGAEIFGSDDLAADAEVVSLMLAAVQAAGVDNPVLLLGHMGISLTLIDALVEQSEQDIDKAELFLAIQRKSEADIAALLPETPLAATLASLPSFMGGAEIIAQAAKHLENAPSGALAALADLGVLVEKVSSDHPGISVRIDVSELSGYGYHNGPVFAVYHPEHGQALAQGGRYDGVGDAFGRGRAATGFDMDLKCLLGAEADEEVIFAPWVSDAVRAERSAFIQNLRAQGQRVVAALNEKESAPPGILHKVCQVDGEWQVCEI